MSSSTTNLFIQLYPLCSLIIRSSTFFPIRRKEFEELDAEKYCNVQDFLVCFFIFLMNFKFIENPTRGKDKQIKLQEAKRESKKLHPYIKS